MNWAQIQDNALNGVRLTALSDLSAVIILSLSAFYRPRRRWDYNGDEVDTAQWDEIEAAISQMEDEVMKGLVGAIIPHVIMNIGNFEALPCDGSTYLREDYPELYAVIHTNLIIDADSFFVPDMRDRFPLGEGTIAGVGDTGGAENHTLDVAEIPAHSHSTLPHSHAEGIATPFPTLVGAGAPAIYAVAGVGSTGLATVTVEDEGGSSSHYNMTPYQTILWMIIAK